MTRNHSNLCTPHNECMIRMDSGRTQVDPCTQSTLTFTSHHRGAVASDDRKGGAMLWQAGAHATVHMYQNFELGCELSTSTVIVPVTAVSVSTVTLQPDGGRATAWGKPLAATTCTRTIAI